MYCVFVFFFQAEDGIRDLVRSRGLGDVYKRQVVGSVIHKPSRNALEIFRQSLMSPLGEQFRTSTFILESSYLILHYLIIYLRKTQSASKMKFSKENDYGWRRILF